MDVTATSFEHELAGKIVNALDDYTIGHITMIANIIRKEMIKWGFEEDPEKVIKKDDE